MVITVHGDFGDADVYTEGGTRWCSADDHRLSKAEIWYEAYPAYPQVYNSDGMWNVTIIPEPASLSLLLLAIAGWQARRLLQRACR